MKKKNWFLVIIIIIAGLLIATVIWIYSKRIENIENKMKVSPTSIGATLLRQIRVQPGGKSFTRLLPRKHTEVIYLSPENKSIFGRELEILQKRYPTQVVLYPVPEKVIEHQQHFRNTGGINQFHN